MTFSGIRIALIMNLSTVCDMIPTPNAFQLCFSSAELLYTSVLRYSPTIFPVIEPLAANYPNPGLGCGIADNFIVIARATYPSSAMSMYPPCLDIHRTSHDSEASKYQEIFNAAPHPYQTSTKMEKVI